jgi:hypothetical protein
VRLPQGTLARKAAGSLSNTTSPGGLILQVALGIKCNITDSQAEQFFWHIQEGDTPATNPYSAVVLDWLDEFLVGVARDEKPHLDITKK